jgi:glyoxylase-like metal-dependent hydrolase (beta-lactamase superfamily II)
MSSIRFTTVNCGPLTLSAGFMMSLAEGIIEIPTPVQIIEHSKHGLILLDTGLNHAISDPEAAERHFGHGVRDGFGAGAITREHAIDAQLKKLGYKQDDVKYVIYSHLHLDHAGGMTYFPHAMHVVQRDELRYAWWPDRWARSVYCHNDFAAARGFDFLELDGDIDLFSDGTIKLKKTPGHAPGHQALILNLKNRGTICLAADLAHSQQAFENFAPMPWDHDLSATTQSYMWAHAISKAGIPVYFAHEMAHFLALPRDGEFWD